MGSMGSVFLYLLLYILAFGVAAIFLVRFCTSFDEMKQQTIEYSENRNAQEIAKKLGLLDKGKMAPVASPSVTVGDDFPLKRNHRIHTFCQAPIRIGILQGVPVKWCATCECVINESQRRGGGGMVAVANSAAPFDLVGETNKAIKSAMKRAY